MRTPMIVYGCGMSAYLPYENLQFNNNIDLSQIRQTSDEHVIRYIVEVDLHFTVELHNKLK